MILHTLNQTTDKPLNDCLNTIASGDSLLLIENGVYNGIQASEQLKRLANLTDEIYLYALKTDCDARGISTLLFSGIALIDYAGFVKLCTEHKQVISWY